MFGRLVLWWRLRQAEKELKAMREYQRKNPNDPRIKELIPLMEVHYTTLMAEKICRAAGWHFSFLCDCCARLNIAYVKPTACQFCGKDAPADLRATDAG